MSSLTAFLSLLRPPLSSSSCTRLFFGARPASSSTQLFHRRHRIASEKNSRTIGNHHATMTSNSSSYMVEQKGSLYKEDFRLYFKDGDGKYISPFHDIPLFRDEKKNLYNMVVEIPRWTNAKMEINRPEKLNPIKQDVKKGLPRFVANVYPYVGYMWNYGALPQTWEDPSHIDEATKCKGDGDPVDVCEIGQRVKERGEVISVKILGVVALVDEGETDWKLLAIDSEDPMADKINDVGDVEKHMPGLLADTVNWFRVYKMPDGKPPNNFAFDGQAKDREYALGVIAETNDQWKKMMGKSDEPEDLSRFCSTYECSSKASKESAQAAVSKTPVGPDAVLSSDIDKWHFVKP